MRAVRWVVEDQEQNLEATQKQVLEEKMVFTFYIQKDRDDR